MDAEVILKDLRNQFGQKSVFYAEDIAAVLGRSVEAVYSLKSRGSLNLPVIETGGRPGVSIYAVAEWLAGGVDESTIKARKAGKDSSVPPVPSPKRRIESLEKHLKGVRVQRAFLAELDDSIERQITELSMGAASTDDRDPVRDGL